MQLELTRLFTTLLLTLSVAAALAQTPENPPPAQAPDATAPAPEPPAKPQFFAGTVTQVDTDRVTVSRSLVGKTPETRTFLIKPETKIGKPLRDRARVTVRYQHQTEGDVALEIRVHSQPRPPKSS
jgi:hypothetical protein